MSKKKNAKDATMKDIAPLRKRIDVLERGMKQLCKIVDKAITKSMKKAAK
jgi:hypothetical protein